MHKIKLSVVLVNAINAANLVPRSYCGKTTGMRHVLAVASEAYNAEELICKIMRPIAIAMSIAESPRAREALMEAFDGMSEFKVEDYRLGSVIYWPNLEYSKEEL